MISVIIPVYNMENYLVECLESLVHQTSQDFEALIIDDGSTDSSSQIGKRYSEEYRNFYYYRKKNGGLSDARNYGMNVAKGAYFLFLDSDDYLFQECIKQHEQLLMTTSVNVDIVVGDMVTSDRREIFKKRILIEEPVRGIDYYKYQLKNGSYRPAAVLQLIRKEFIQKNDISFVVGIYHEDEEFTAKVYLMAEHIVDMNYTYYYYRRHREGSIMTAPENLDKRVFNLRMIYENLSKLVVQLQDPELMDLFNHYWLLRTFDYVNTFVETKKLKEFLNQPLDQCFFKKLKIKNGLDKKLAMRKQLYEFSPILYYGYIKQKNRRNDKK